MTLKLGLMHSPRSSIRLPATVVDYYAPRRIPVASDNPMEFLVRMRENRRRLRRSWKGV